jgi:hypothetical protein
MTISDEDLVPSTRIELGAVLDRYSTDDGTVILVGKEPTCRVLRLSPLGEEILDLVGTGTTLHRLGEGLRARLGDPPSGDLTELVRSAVIALLVERVVVAGQGRKTDIPDVVES